MGDDLEKPLTNEEAMDAVFEAAAACASASGLANSLMHKRVHTSSSTDHNYAAIAPLFPCYGAGLSWNRAILHEQRRMALQGRSRKQHARSSTVRLEIKMPRVPMVVEEACVLRKWDEMNYDILVIIMKHMEQMSTLYRSFFVCKSWMSAVLDSLFPPGNVLDLRFFILIPPDEKRYFVFFLKVLLNRPHQYTKLFFPQWSITSKMDLYIAQRLPKLKCLVQPKGARPFSHENLVPYWPELNEAHCLTSCVYLLSEHCKNIRILDLIGGRIGDDMARQLATCFPRLVHLSVQTCILSPNALSIILQGQPDLTYLDTRHAFCIKGNTYGPIRGNVIEWDEDAVRQKKVGIKTYLQCARRYCSYCAPLYTSKELSPADIIRFDNS